MWLSMRSFYIEISNVLDTFGEFFKMKVRDRRLTRRNEWCNLADFWSWLSINKFYRMEQSNVQEHSRNPWVFEATTSSKSNRTIQRLPPFSRIRVTLISCEFENYRSSSKFDRFIHKREEKFQRFYRSFIVNFKLPSDFPLPPLLNFLAPWRRRTVLTCK